MSRRGSWRVGRTYGVHVYECAREDGLACDEDRPVATFHDPADAQLAVLGRNGSPEVLARTAEVLVAHQRHTFSACLCGWAELGRSHPEHQAAMLVEEGLLR